MTWKSFPVPEVLAPPAVEPLDAEIAAHREARLRRLTAEDGWLSIIGKFWLSEGSHLMGSGAGCELRLPAASSPPVLGRVTLRGGVVRFLADPEAVVSADGRRVTELELRPDDETSPSKLVSGSLTLQLLRRGAELALRVRDANNPLRVRFRGIPCYPVDPGWRILAPLQRFASERSLIYEDSDGRPQSYACPGIIRFEKDGSVGELWPVFEPDRRRLFVLFSDGTSSDETYGAGRFLYVPLPGDTEADVVVDFNKAFNPPCAFTEFAACPLPPPRNRLAFRVDAGEKRPFVE